MAFVTGPKDGGESSEKELVARLRKFVEDSDLSFYKIASRIGTSGGILSMWLAETTRPRPEELDAIEKFLGRRPKGFGGSLKPSQTPKDSQADANPEGT
jgi:transcriptional regulator with XRE-family HTH domain